MPEPTNGSRPRAAELVLEALLQHDPGAGLSRSQIAAVAELPLATTSRAVSNLRDRGLLDVDDNGLGRREAGPVRLRSSAGHALGVVFDHEGIYWGRGDLWGRVEPQRDSWVAMDVDHDPHAALDWAADKINGLLGKTGREDELIGIGIGVAAPVDPLRRDLRGDLGGEGRTTMPSWLQLDPREEMRERLRPASPTMVLANNANLVALAEYQHARRSWDGPGELENVLCIHWGSGLGAGLILGGQLYEGSGGIAGELGHSPVPWCNEVEALLGGRRADEAGCRRCGFAHCLEFLVSSPVSRGQGSPGRDWIAHAARLVGRSLGPIINMINPQLLVLAGRLPGGYRELVPELQRGLRETALRPAIRDVRVRLGLPGPEAGVTGAIEAILEQERFNFLLRKDADARPQRRQSEPAAQG